MSRYPGKLTTDVYGTLVDEMRVAHIQLSATESVAAAAEGLIKNKALTTAAQTVTTFLASMPYPRNVQVVASDAATTKITVNGTNMADDVISEELTLNGTTPVLGAKAFKTVTSVVLPIKTGSENVDVGWADTIGLPFMMAAKPLAFAMDDGAIETTAPTVVADADELEKNTITLRTAMDGSVIDIFLVL